MKENEVRGRKKYVLHHSTPIFLDVMRSHTEPYTIELFGKDIIIFPEVFSPYYDWSGQFHVRHIGDVRGKRVLDMGCGSGIIGLFAALQGASDVLSVDVNPRAVENANLNFQKHGLKHARAIESDVFLNVDSLFDVIVFNLPYHGAESKDMLEKAVADTQYATMKTFLESARKYLVPNGEVQVGFSTSGDVDLLREEIKKNGYVIEKIFSESDRGYNCQLYVLRTQDDIQSFADTIAIMPAEKAQARLASISSDWSDLLQVATKLLPHACISIRQYESGQQIVDHGSMIDMPLMLSQPFQYATIPFGIILQGACVVRERGVGVRRLGAGDCFGIFETAHWINTKAKRSIGEWTLTTEGDTIVIFFGMDFLTESIAVRNYIVKQAQVDHVPQPVTSLELLDWTAAHTTDSLLSDTCVVMHTHILPTNVEFIRHVAHLVGIDNMFILEKPYSTIHDAFSKLVRAGIDVVHMPINDGDEYEAELSHGIDVLWKKVRESYGYGNFQSLIIFDDGGDLLGTVPWGVFDDVRVVGVEQTQRGITRLRKSNMRLPPIVSVASSGVKKIVESSFIGKAIVEKFVTFPISCASRRVGVIGMGNVGRSIFRELLDRGFDPLCYDVEKPDGIESTRCRSSIDEFLKDVDCVFGATGTDVLKGVTLDHVLGQKIFISASSSNIEFRSLVKLARPCNFGEVHVSPHVNLECTVLNGGFPLNFDRTKEWEKNDDIALTRCLLYVGLMQSVALVKGNLEPGFYALDVTAQERILRKWIAKQNDTGKHIPVEWNNCERIAKALFIEDVKTMPTIWKE